MCTGEGLSCFMMLARHVPPFVIFRRLGLLVKDRNMRWKRAACF